MFLQATVVHFDALPLIVRQSLVACLRGQGSPVPTLGQPVPRRWPLASLAILMASGVVLGAGGAVPGRAPALAAMVVAGAVASLTLARLLRAWLAVRRLPWPPGQYVLGAYLVDATRAVLRIESAMAVTATEVVHHRVDGGHTVTTIDIWTRDHVYRFAVRRREDARAALDRLEADLVAMIEALRAGEVDAVARLDPLFEARGDERLSSVAPPMRPSLPPRLGWRPWSWSENVDARQAVAGVTDRT
jgi:hypothetical protein